MERALGPGPALGESLLELIKVRDRGSALKFPNPSFMRTGLQAQLRQPFLKNN